MVVALNIGLRNNLISPLKPGFIPPEAGFFFKEDSTV
jgi:hypothetical protein